MGFHLSMCVMPLPENGVLRNFDLEVSENATLREVQSQLPDSRFYVHLPEA